MKFIHKLFLIIIFVVILLPAGLLLKLFHIKSLNYNKKVKKSYWKEIK